MGGDGSRPEGKNHQQLKQWVLKPGEIFGNFQVTSCLCVGLVANYYHMQHIRDLHDLTVGILHHRVGKNPHLLRRLQALHKISQSCDHEGIPKITDILVINQQLCIFQEPVSGQTLSQYFEANAAPGQHGVGVETTAHVMARLLGLLGYAHSQGLDHRDIDSDMIMIREDGSISVLGLGIKAALGTELFESIVSASVSPLVSNKTLNRLNSFDVMSPEYQQGMAEDLRGDLYCAGTIGYWLLTGRNPDRNQLVLPTTLLKDLPAQWDIFFKGLLQREQEQRFQSCRTALLSLKDCEHQPESEHAGFIQRQIDRIPVPQGILDRGEQRYLYGSPDLKTVPEGSYTIYTAMSANGRWTLTTAACLVAA